MKSRIILAIAATQLAGFAYHIWDIQPKVAPKIMDYTPQVFVAHEHTEEWSRPATAEDYARRTRLREERNHVETLGEHYGGNQEAIDSHIHQENINFINNLPYRPL